MGTSHSARQEHHSAATDRLGRFSDPFRLRSLAFRERQDGIVAFPDTHFIFARFKHQTTAQHDDFLVQVAEHVLRRNLTMAPCELQFIEAFHRCHGLSQGAVNETFSRLREAQSEIQRDSYESLGTFAYDLDSDRKRDVQGTFLAEEHARPVVHELLLSCVATLKPALQLALYHVYEGEHVGILTARRRVIIMNSRSISSASSIYQKRRVRQRCSSLGRRILK